MSLEDRVAVVTGGASGIGLATAQRLAEDGAIVAVVDVDEERGHAAAERERIIFIRGDVSGEGDVGRAIARVDEEYGGVDVLVNNAGIAHGPASEQHFFDTTGDMWDRLVAVNLRGLYLCTQYAGRVMAQRRRRGAIVNVSSAGASRAHRHRVAYDATKGAIEAATRALALDLAPWGIRVNAVAPGMIEVPERSAVGASPPAEVVPLGRAGKATEVAAAVRFLASDDASYITGATLLVDGGLAAQLRSPAVDLPVTSVSVSHEEDA